MGCAPPVSRALSSACTSRSISRAPLSRRTSIVSARTSASSAATRRSTASGLSRSLATPLHESKDRVGGHDLVALIRHLDVPGDDTLGNARAGASGRRLFFRLLLAG